MIENTTQLVNHYVDLAAEHAGGADSRMEPKDAPTTKGLRETAASYLKSARRLDRNLVRELYTTARQMSQLLEVA